VDAEFGHLPTILVIYMKFLVSQFFPLNFGKIQAHLKINKPAHKRAIITMLNVFRAAKIGNYW
jgi:hypothetical protein